MTIAPRHDGDGRRKEPLHPGPAYPNERSDSAVTPTLDWAMVARRESDSGGPASGELLAALRPRATLLAENLVLRQQLAILPRLRPSDRAFWGAQPIAPTACYATGRDIAAFHHQAFRVPEATRQGAICA
jgi:hypothetical protein